MTKIGFYGFKQCEKPRTAAAYYPFSDRLSDIIVALASTGSGYSLRLYSDPVQALPDHHLLVVVEHGQEHATLPTDAAQALIQAMVIDDNHHRVSKP